MRGGGLPSNLAEATRSDMVLADLGKPVQSQKNALVLKFLEIQPLRSQPRRLWKPLGG